MILADTSVWIDHFRRGNVALVEALERDEVLIHPFVIGELACGELKKRTEILNLLTSLSSVVVATDEEVLHFIDEHRLAGKGLGYVDAHLLASVALTDGAHLWTFDKRLAAIADRLA